MCIEKTHVIFSPVAVGGDDMNEQRKHRKKALNEMRNEASSQKVNLRAKLSSQMRRNTGETNEISDSNRCVEK